MNFIIIAMLYFLFSTAVHSSELSCKAGTSASESNPPFCVYGTETAHEMSLTLLSKRILTPFSGQDKFITLDVGSSFGWYSIYWARLGFHVIAIEPGDTAPLLAAVDSNRFRDRVNILNSAITGPSSQSDAESKKMDSESLLEHVPPDKEIAIIKIDVKGSEIGVLFELIGLMKKGVKIHNIIVEFTPKSWPDRQLGEHVINKFIRHNFTFVSVPWPEHATRVQNPPHGLQPKNQAIDWDNEPLLFAQRVSSDKIVEYVMSIKYQRAIWLQHPHSPYPLDYTKNEIGDIQCPAADEWKYHKMPRYLTDRKNVELCMDLYHSYVEKAVKL